MYASQGEHSKALLTAETMLRGDGRVEHQAGKPGLNSLEKSCFSREFTGAFGLDLGLKESFPE